MNSVATNTIFLEDESATVTFGRRIGQELSTGGVIFLAGTLGAGKTTFCRGVMAAFGHSGAVKSPTYTLVEPYEFGEVSLFHFDLYRLGDPEELEYMGIRDYFDSASICLIEWPVKGRGFLPEADLVLTFSPVDSGRSVNIESNTPRGDQALLALNED